MSLRMASEAKNPKVTSDFESSDLVIAEGQKDLAEVCVIQTRKPRESNPS